VIALANHPRDLLVCERDVLEGERVGLRRARFQISWLVLPRKNAMRPDIATRLGLPSCEVPTRVELVVVPATILKAHASRVVQLP
jgi:hypothetical protein